VGGDEASQLLVLAPASTFTYTFNNGQAPVTETMDLSNADIVIDDGRTDLVANLPDGGTLFCSILSTGPYLCFRFYSGTDLAMSLFEMNGNVGSGAFEVCSTTQPSNVCVDNFFEAPDGTVSVTAGIQNASVEGAIQSQDGAYMSYMKQGETGDANGLANGLNKADVLESAMRLMNTAK